MSNKKRISKRVKAIEGKEDLKRFIKACGIANAEINKIIQSKRKIYNQIATAIDSNGDRIFFFSN